MANAASLKNPSVIAKNETNAEQMKDAAPAAEFIVKPLQVHQPMTPVPQSSLILPFP